MAYTPVTGRSHHLPCLTDPHRSRARILAVPSDVEASNHGLLRLSSKTYDSVHTVRLERKEVAPPPGFEPGFQEIRSKLTTRLD
ncbi:MAG: hypothetical protein ACTSV3_07710 [Candidatus Thorarchaeota archaeon]